VLLAVRVSTSQGLSQRLVLCTKLCLHVCMHVHYLQPQYERNAHVQIRYTPCKPEIEYCWCTYVPKLDGRSHLEWTMFVLASPDLSKRWLNAQNIACVCACIRTTQNHNMIEKHMYKFNIRQDLFQNQSKIVWVLQGAAFCVLLLKYLSNINRSWPTTLHTRPL
jgi:hypothetical protein